MILSHFFAAHPAQLERVPLRRGPTGWFPTIELATFTPVELARLYQVVRGRDPGDIAATLDDFQAVWQAGPQGPYVFRLPEALQRSLGDARQQEIADYAARWIETEEMRGAPLEDTVALLEDLALMAATSTVNGRALFLWNHQVDDAD